MKNSEFIKAASRGNLLKLVTGATPSGLRQAKGRVVNSFPLSETVSRGASPFREHLGRNAGKYAAGGIGGGYLFGNNLGYERGNQHGFNTGFGQGYTGGFDTAATQASNTGFLGRLMGNLEFDPRGGLQNFNPESLNQFRKDNRAGMLNRSGMYVPFFGG